MHVTPVVVTVPSVHGFARSMLALPLTTLTLAVFTLPAIAIDAVLIARKRVIGNHAHRYCQQNY
jgi:hypothetical protein